MRLFQAPHKAAASTHHLPTKLPLSLSFAVNAPRLHLIDKTLALNPCLRFCHHSFLSHLFIFAPFKSRFFTYVSVVNLLSAHTFFFPHYYLSDLLPTGTNSPNQSMHCIKKKKTKYALQTQLCDPLLKNTPICLLLFLRVSPEYFSVFFLL